MLNIDALVESQGLFQTTFPNGYKFMWRLLNLKEYRVFQALRDGGVLMEVSVYIRVFERCYAGDFNLINMHAPVGMYASIGELIMYLSGDCETDTLKSDLISARQIYPANSVQEHMKRVVLTAFPSYTIEDVDSWTRQELIRRFTFSENLLVYRFGHEPLDIDKIRAESGTPEARGAPPVDFEKEAAAQWKDLHPLDYYDAMAKEVEQEKSQKKQLKASQARKLDSITR